MDRALGIIPARGGSKGLPGKNLMRLGGKTLVEWAIESANAAKTLMHTMVTSNDPAVIEVADAYGVYSIPRPPELATDEAGMMPTLQHALAAAERLVPRFDLVVCLQPTSPFRTGEDIDECVRLVVEQGADSAQTVVEAPYPASKLMLLDYRGEVAFMNEHEARRDTRRQDYEAYQPSGSVYVTRRHVLMERGHIIGECHYGLPRPWERSININTLWDFRIAEMIYAHRRLG